MAIVKKIKNMNILQPGKAQYLRQKIIATITTIITAMAIINIRIGLVLLPLPISFSALIAAAL